MSYEIGNRSIAQQGVTEGRSRTGQAKAANEVHRAKVTAVMEGAVKVGVLDDSGRVVRIYTVSLGSEDSYSVGDRLSVKVHEQSKTAVILSAAGGSANCCTSFLNWGPLP